MYVTCRILHTYLRTQWQFKLLSLYCSDWRVFLWNHEMFEHCSNLRKTLKMAHLYFRIYIFLYNNLKIKLVHTRIDTACTNLSHITILQCDCQIKFMRLYHVYVYVHAHTNQASSCTDIHTNVRSFTNFRKNPLDFTTLPSHEAHVCRQEIDIKDNSCVTLRKSFRLSLTLSFAIIVPIKYPHAHFGFRYPCNERSTWWHQECNAGPLTPS